MNTTNVFSELRGKIKSMVKGDKPVSEAQWTALAAAKLRAEVEAEVDRERQHEEHVASIRADYAAAQAKLANAQKTMQECLVKAKEIEAAQGAHQDPDWTMNIDAMTTEQVQRELDIQNLFAKRHVAVDREYTKGRRDREEAMAKVAELENVARAEGIDLSVPVA